MHLPCIIEGASKSPHRVRLTHTECGLTYCTALHRHTSALPSFFRHVLTAAATLATNVSLYHPSFGFPRAHGRSEGILKRQTGCLSDADIPLPSFPSSGTTSLLQPPLPLVCLCTTSHSASPEHMAHTRLTGFLGSALPSRHWRLDPHHPLGGQERCVFERG